MTVRSYYFRQCLLHRMRNVKGQCNEYVLPYAYDLDSENYWLLATRLCEAGEFPKEYVSVFETRLRHKDLTQRLEQARLATDDVGLWQLTWRSAESMCGRFGLPNGYFVVLSEDPRRSLAMPKSALNNLFIATTT